MSDILTPLDNPVAIKNEVKRIVDLQRRRVHLLQESEGMNNPEVDVKTFKYNPHVRYELDLLSKILKIQYILEKFSFGAVPQGEEMAKELGEGSLEGDVPKAGLSKEEIEKVRSGAKIASQLIKKDPNLIASIAFGGTGESGTQAETGVSGANKAKDKPNGRGTEKTTPTRKKRSE